ncbi:hypothetical protein JCM17960_33050 [Magnetospira thiophila]
MSFPRGLPFGAQQGLRLASGETVAAERTFAAPEIDHRKAATPLDKKTLIACRQTVAATVALIGKSRLGNGPGGADRQPMPTPRTPEQQISSGGWVGHFPPIPISDS